MYWNGGYNGMMGWGGGMMLFQGIFWLLFLVLIVVGIVALLRGGWGGHGPRGGHPHRRSPGLEVLEERYARGEIQREEYLQKKRDLGG